MAHTSHDRNAATQRIWCGALLALTGSLAILMLATPGAAPAVYWAASSVALLTALAVVAAGECAWERIVANARAAGVVAR